MIRLALALLLAIGTAQAYERNTVILRLTVSTTSIGNDAVAMGYSLATGVRALESKFGNDTQPAINLTWMMSKRVGLELSTSAAYKHNLRAADTPGRQDMMVGRNVMQFKQQPVALNLMIYPLGNRPTRIQPYLGFGTTYTHMKIGFHDDWIDGLAEQRGLDEAGREELRAQSRARWNGRGNQWGVNSQAGLDIGVTEHVLINLNARYTVMPDFSYWTWAAGLGLRF